MNKLTKTVIIAPHPDDEWIGCGCTMLKKIDNKENVVVLLITREERTERRVNISKELAEYYVYDLHIHGVKEKEIKDTELASFLKRYINHGDVVYVPDVDLHPDHVQITKVVQNHFDNRMYQYCVYNNSTNIFTRANNILARFFRGYTPSSFRSKKMNGAIPNVIKLDYKLEEKNENITKFGEAKRGPDILRVIKNGRK